MQILCERKYRFIIAIIICELDDEIAAPLIPRIGIKNIFKIISIKKQNITP